MGSSRRSVLLAAALVVAAGAASLPLCAQGPQAPLVLSGRAVRVRGRDTTALAGAVVVAHRIGLREQGPLDSLKADARGAFRFRLARPDTGVMYVVSTRYAGIGYFSEPFSVRDHAGADTIRLAVYDTAATGSPLVVAVRHLVISAPGGDGSRDALDIVQVGNGGETTRVPRDSTSPTWHMKLPRGIESFRVGEGDVPNSAVVLAADSILVSAPFPPGLKQVPLFTNMSVVLLFVMPMITMRLFAEFLRPHRFRMAGTIACSIVAAALDAFSFTLLIPFLNELFKADPDRIIPATGGWISELQQRLVGAFLDPNDRLGSLAVMIAAIVIIVIVKNVFVWLGGQFGASLQ